MVCERCILVVKQQVENLGLTVTEIKLGTVAVTPDPNTDQLKSLSNTFQQLGFELIDKEKDQLVEQIKTQVIALVHYSDLSAVHQSLMSIIAERLKKEYTYLSRQFSEAEGITIEKYMIQQKVEKVKELLEYGELNLNEIAYKMGYSSGAHLSTQFKSVTGLAPSKYKQHAQGSRKPLDQLG